MWGDRRWSGQGVRIGRVVARVVPGQESQGW